MSFLKIMEEQFEWWRKATDMGVRFADLETMVTDGLLRLDWLKECIFLEKTEILQDEAVVDVWNALVELCDTLVEVATTVGFMEKADDVEIVFEDKAELAVDRVDKAEVKKIDSKRRADMTEGVDKSDKKRHAKKVVELADKAERVDKVSTERLMEEHDYAKIDNVKKEVKEEQHQWGRERSIHVDLDLSGSQLRRFIKEEGVESEKERKRRRLQDIFKDWSEWDEEEDRKMADHTGKMIDNVAANTGPWRFEWISAEDQGHRVNTAGDSEDKRSRSKLPTTIKHA